jgi:hypothetical protein
MAALLIERGAELTPVAASALGRWDYLASCPLDSLQGKGVLQAAVRDDRPDVLRRLLERGLDPNERIQLGQLEDQTFSSGGPLLEAVNTGRIDMARLLLAHGADPNASVYTAGSATAAAYTGGSPRTHAPDQAMIDLMVEHGGWIDAGRRCLPAQFASCRDAHATSLRCAPPPRRTPADCRWHHAGARVRRSVGLLAPARRRCRSRRATAETPAAAAPQTSEHALEVGTERLSSVVDKSDPHLVLHTCVRGPHAR